MPAHLQCVAVEGQASVDFLRESSNKAVTVMYAVHMYPHPEVPAAAYTSLLEGNLGECHYFGAASTV